MPSNYTRRNVLHLCGVTGAVSIAGCSNISMADDPEGSSSNESSADGSDISNTTAKERALAAEEDFLTEHLERRTCLEDWGTSGSTGSEEARVTNRSADGVTVKVKHPYSYTGNSQEADRMSEAVYLVTEEETERVRGDAFSASCR